MKRLLPLLFIWSCSLAYSQQVLMYQSVLRDHSGELLADTTVQITVSIKDSADVVYVENISTRTNSNGLVSFLLGSEYGSLNPNAAFKTIPWKNGEFYIKLENNGGTDFQMQDYQHISAVSWTFSTFEATGDLDDRLARLEAFLRSKGIIP